MKRNAYVIDVRQNRNGQVFFGLSVNGHEAAVLDLPLPDYQRFCRDLMDASGAVEYVIRDIPSPPVLLCPRCRGEGELSVNNASAPFQDIRPCPRCDGRGRLLQEELKLSEEDHAPG